MNARECSIRNLLLSYAATLVIACSPDWAVTPVPHDLRVIAVSPTELHAIVAQKVQPAPTVQVVDLDGNPVRGIQVTFIGQGLGVDNKVVRAVITSPDGKASVEDWVLGTIATEYELKASIGRSNEVVRFRAQGLADEPAQLIRLSGFGASIASPGETIDLSVAVADRFGNRLWVPDVPVQFRITAGSGTLSVKETATNAKGEAQTQLSLAVRQEFNSVEAVSKAFYGPFFSVETIDGLHTRVYSLESIDSKPFFNRGIVGGFIALTDDGNFIDTYAGFSPDEVEGVWRSTGRYETLPSQLNLIFGASRNEMVSVVGDDLLVNRFEPGTYRCCVVWRYRKYTI